MVKEESEFEVNDNFGKIFFYEDGIKDEDHTISGDIYINHLNKEVRIYNFHKTEFTDIEKYDLLYTILKSTCLFPSSLKSISSDNGIVAEYTLMINGYLLDGTFKEQGVRYKTIIEEFVETSSSSNDNDSMYILKEKIKHFYNKYRKYIGKEEVKLVLTNKSFFKGITEYINFTILFGSYLRTKGKRVKLFTTNKLWRKEKELIIAP